MDVVKRKKSKQTCFDSSPNPKKEKELLKEDKLGLSLLLEATNEAEKKALATF